MAAILAGAVLVLLAAAGAGRLAWRGPAPHWTLALASGAPLVSLALFVLLTLGGAFPAIVLTGCAASALALVRARPRWSWPAWPAWTLAPFFVYYLIHALAPEIQPDAAGYHLGLVAAWARTHGFVFENGFYDILPAGLETLFLPAFMLGAHSAAKLVHFAFFCATFPLISRIGERFGLSPAQRVAAAGLYLLTPVAAVAGTSAYNDTAAVFFPLAVFALLLEDHAKPGSTLLFHAGLAAGFCYAVKSPGLVVVAGALGWILYRRRWHGALAFSAGAGISLLPWMGRALWLAGNPLAPLASAIFPNDAFHLSSEQALGAYLRSYDGLGWTAIPWALGIDGARLQGLVGPLVFFLPLALLAARKPAGRALLCATAVLLVPWTQNIGARFLLPALALAALALVYGLPRRAALILLLAQAVVCSPFAVERYSQRGAWRLRGWPWRAALRIEPEATYLEKNLFEYSLVRKLSARLQPGERVLDFYGLPFAYLNAVPTGPQSTREFDDLARAFDMAAQPIPGGLRTWNARFSPRFARAVRVRLERTFPGEWSIAEVRVKRQGVPLAISKNWFLRAWPEPADAALAIDGARATRWFTFQPAQPGMHWELRFDRPQPIDEVVATLPDHPDPDVAAIYLQGLDRRWSRASTAIGPLLRRTFRDGATRFADARGFRWIVVPIGSGGRGQLGVSFDQLPEAWGVEKVAQTEGLALFHIQPLR
jgi:hypothetical protein